jgi:hypothetical protein
VDGRAGAFRWHSACKDAQNCNLPFFRPLLKKFADLGGMMLGGSPAEFGKFVAAETGKWAKVIHEANIALME